MLDLQDGLHEALPKLVAEHGGFFTMQFPSGALGLPTHKLDGPTAVLCDPDLLQEVYNRHEDFNKKLFKHSVLRTGLAGDGLFTSDDDEGIHDQAARVLLPAFSMNGMKEYFGIIGDCTETLLKVFDGKASGSSLLDLHPLLSKYTFEIISRVCFGKEFNAMTEPCDFLDLFDEWSDLGVQMKRTPPFASLRVADAVLSGNLKKRKALEAQMTAFIRQILSEKKEKIEAKCPVTGHAGKCPMKDMAERMLTVPDPQSGKHLPEDNIVSQTATFLVAGHDSTSTAITMLLFHLAQNPEVEEKVYQEVMSVVGHGPITWDALGKMSYCTQVVKENLRMYSPAFQFQKNSRTDRDTNLGPYAIPAGTSFIISTWGLHHNPKVYPNPSKFDPDRWSPENAAKRSPYAWLPFSYGKRGCIGQQLSLIEQRVVLAEVVRRFHVRLDLSTNVVTTVPLFLNPQGIHLKVACRSQGAIPIAVAAATGPAALEASAADMQIGKLDELAGRNLVVLFGSNMGTCEDLADRFVRRGEAMGLDATKMTLDALCSDGQSVDLPKGDAGLVVVITSSYNGQPPDNARNFDAWLDGPTAAEALQGVRFAIFGCGNKQWAATYQAFPRKVFEHFTALGGAPMAPLGEGDMDSGEAEFTFARWEIGTCIALMRSHKIPVPENITDALYPKLPEYEAFLWSGMRFKDLSQTRLEDLIVDVKSRAKSMFLKDNKAWMAHVDVNRELLKLAQPQGRKNRLFSVKKVPSEPSAPVRSTRHLEISLPEGVRYSAGDHLGVVGANPDSVVLAHLDHLGIAHDAVFKIETEEKVDTALVPLGVPWGAYQLLAWCVELQQPVSRVQLRALSKLATEESERKRLVELSDWNEEQTGDAYEEHVQKQRRTVLEILQEFSSVKLGLGQLLGLLPSNKPRYYSISSSPKVSPSAVTVTVNVVDGIAPTGRRHLGLCSNFLKQQPKQMPPTVHPSRDVRFAAFVKDTGSTFRLPKSPSVPVIMVGPGTGVAPMRGFLQDRVAEGAKENVLFFGCRDETEFLYQEELRAWQKEGALELHVAFSRKPGQPKVYVQELVLKEGARLTDLVRRGAHIYVCGDASKMAPDVMRAFWQVLVKAGLPETIVEEMVEEGRYSQDVWAAQSI
jgi:cytochrome P450/NADPH-cytochrome P450 reductase